LAAQRPVVLQWMSTCSSSSSSSSTAHSSNDRVSGKHTHAAVAGSAAALGAAPSGPLEGGQLQLTNAPTTTGLARLVEYSNKQSTFTQHLGGAAPSGPLGGGQLQQHKSSNIKAATSKITTAHMTAQAPVVP
jgi:hypothetical protein